MGRESKKKVEHSTFLFHKVMMNPLEWSLNNIRSIVLKRKFLSDYPTVIGSDMVYYCMLPVRDKVVLDLGAFNGDTALLFLRRGARKVICIEPNPSYAKHIYKLKSVEVRIRRAYKEDLLADDYDVVKCDIEGFEYPLLPFFPLHKPIVIEIHNLFYMEEFYKHGFKPLKIYNDGRSIMKRGF